MPWLSVSWEGEDVRRELATNLEVQGIPTFVVLGPDNAVITAEGRAELAEDPEAERFPWRPQSVEVLAERHMARLQESPCLVLFTDGETTSSSLDATCYSPWPRSTCGSTRRRGVSPLQFFVAGEVSAGRRMKCPTREDFACLEDAFSPGGHPGPRATSSSGRRRGSPPPTVHNFGTQCIATGNSHRCPLDSCKECYKQHELNANFFLRRSTMTLLLATLCVH
ncbi:Nucleoredoxin, partial [Penaeus vannamei]